MSAALKVVSGGVLTTVQDRGRQDAVRYGIPRGGAMDFFALQAANRLVDNAPDAAAIEITSGGALFEVLRPLLLAVTGVELGATWNDEPLPLWTAILPRRGDRIAVAGRRTPWGARAYLALSGGVDVPLVLGSCSTHLPSGFGGFAGRPLRSGDTIAANGPDGDPKGNAGRIWPLAARPDYRPEPALRFIPGPHLDCFHPDAVSNLADAPFHVSQQANRMGYRLEGIRMPYVRPCSLPSLGVIPGVIQVPPDGMPILLMADAQTTGGYPIIGTVIGPDLPLAAQLLPGDTLRLTPVGLEDALAARRMYAAWLATVLHSDESMLQLALTGALGSGMMDDH